MAENEENAQSNDAADSGVEAANHRQQAAQIVRDYSLGTVGAGLIPLPIADIAAISLVQLKMLHSLTKLYGVPFSKNLGKSVIAAFTGSVASEGIGRMTLGSLLKSVPLVGPVLGALAMPAVAGATTTALGQVFVHHFEGGGTLLDIDLKFWQPFYQEQVATAN